MPPWIGSMEQQDRRSTRHLPGSSSSSNSWSVRSVMYSSGASRGSVKCSSSSLSPAVAVSSGTTATPGCRLRWVLGVVVTLLTVLSRADAVCDPDRWWNLEREECIPCTVCGEQQLVLRPCQEYMDTVCGTIGDLDMDLAQLARTEARHEQRHWKEERRKDGSSDAHQHQRPHQQHQHNSAGGQPHPHPGSARKRENTEEILWDWQAASLLLAIIGCLLFFFAAAIIALNQTRQWKRIEKHFDADMEALSAQLMNHLSSMQQLENGSIFLDDVLSGDQRRFHRGGGGMSAERSGGGDSISSTSALLGGHHHHHHHHPIEVRCVYLDQLLDGKNCIQSQGPGNLYIEETNNSTNVDRGLPSSPLSCHPPPSANSSPLNRVRMY